VIIIENSEILFLSYIEQQALQGSGVPGRSTCKPLWFFHHGIPRELSGRSDSEACFSRSNSFFLVTMVSPVPILTSVHKPHYIILVTACWI